MPNYGNNPTPGVFHLAANPDQYEIVRTNNFRFIVHGLEDLVRVAGNPNDRNDHLRNAQEIIDFSVKSFDAPHFTQQAIEISRGNSKMKFAGVPNFTQGNLVVNDYAGADSKSILEAWQNLSYDVVNDTIARSNVYKKNATVLEYLPDNTLVRYWDLYGCWVSSISENAWDNGSNTGKEITAQITFDRAIPHQPD